MSLLSLDNLAHRYGLLPSEVMLRATTFDLYVIDLSARYERYRNDLAEGKVKDPKNDHIMKLYNIAKNYHNENNKERK